VCVCVLFCTQVDRLELAEAESRRLGQQLRAQVGHPEHAYADWITTYADPGFEQLTRGLEELLDRLAAADTPVADTYRRAMELELAFFAAHTPGVVGDGPGNAPAGASQFRQGW
jgi:hypothetical protein